MRCSEEVGDLGEHQLGDVVGARVAEGAGGQERQGAAAVADRAERGAAHSVADRAERVPDCHGGPGLLGRRGRQNLGGEDPDVLGIGQQPAGDQPGLPSGAGFDVTAEPARDVLLVGDGPLVGGVSFGDDEPGGLMGEVLDERDLGRASVTRRRRSPAPR